MARQPIVPEIKTCPVDGTQFEVGGRGRPKRSAVYCSRRCLGLATYKNLPVEKGTHVPRPRKNRDTLHNEAWLRNRYLTEKATTGDIAAELGCSTPAVSWALRKFAIPVRDASEAKRGRPNKAVWTPVAREALALQRRGEANPMHGTASPNRGDNYDPDPQRRGFRYQRAYRYGVTGKQYDAMLEAQGGVCLVCGAAETRVHKSGVQFTLAVDHCHLTGKVRGLLCSLCNMALGSARDNPALLRKLADYLESHAIE